MGREREVIISGSVLSLEIMIPRKFRVRVLHGKRNRRGRERGRKADD